MDGATRSWSEALTPRKREVVSGLAEGLSIKEIAQKMGISRETVKQHASELYEMHGVHSARELLASRWERVAESGAAALLKEEPASLDELITSLLAKIRQIAPAAAVRLVPLQNALGRALEIPCPLAPEQCCLLLDSVPPLPEHIAAQVRLLALVASFKALRLQRREPLEAAAPWRRPEPQAPPVPAALDHAVFELRLWQAVWSISSPEQRAEAGADARSLGASARVRGGAGGC